MTSFKIHIKSMLEFYELLLKLLETKLIQIITIFHHRKMTRFTKMTDSVKNIFNKTNL